VKIVEVLYFLFILPPYMMQYKPLDKAKNEIRVLRFRNLSSPVSTDDLIQCSIENVPLEERSPQFQSNQEYLQNQNCPMVWDKFTKCVDLRDTTLEQTTLDKATSIGLCQAHTQSSDSRYAWGDFEALSYSWGDRDDVESIRTNGIDRKVSKNLEAALRALRELQETRLGMCYWVDQLCIDQNNLVERNEQVKRMRDIYGRARAVIVWLGQEEKTDEIAVRTMRHLCWNPCVKAPLQLPAGLLVDGWHALFAFVRKPYWNRAWIIQELAMNHNSTLIMCGRFKLTRRMLLLGSIYCQELLQAYEERSDQSEHDLEPGAWRMASRVHRLASLTSNPNVEVKLSRSLDLVRRADATNESDKVYSILGLLDPAISADIIPNYALSVQQVFTDFTIAIIKNSASPDQIMFGGIPTQKGWPSWVPDSRLPFVRHHIQYLRCRQASGNLPAEIRFCKNERDYDLLVCSGFQVDTVDGIAAEPCPEYHSTQSQDTLDRYSGRTSEALEQTLLMGHPGATEKALFKITWPPKRDATISRSRSTPKRLRLSQSSYFRKFHKFREHNQDFRIGGQSLRSFFPKSGRKRVRLETVLPCMRLATLSLDQRALITTRTGYLGLAPIAVRQGDVVAILLGCRCPIVLRPCSDGLYQVIGECYIHGLMDGEILSQEREGHVSRQEFVLC
jgi:hypothetical protein